MPRQWTAPLVRDLRRDHAVVNFDYEPHDEWDGVTHVRTSVEMAADVLAVMDHIGLARAHIVGTSRGAVAAYALGARNPERVLSLSLLVPVAPYPDLLLDPTPTPEAAAAERPTDPDELPRFFADLTFSEVWMRDHGDEMVAMIASGPWSVERLPRGEEEPVGRDEVPAQPTLVVTARDDRVVHVENADAVCDVLPDARRAELPGQHGALLEDPSAWADEIRAFIGRISEPG